jgi:hypothetical protein
LVVAIAGEVLVGPVGITTEVLVRVEVNVEFANGEELLNEEGVPYDGAPLVKGIVLEVLDEKQLFERLLVHDDVLDGEEAPDGVDEGMP